MRVLRSLLPVILCACSCGPSLLGAGIEPGPMHQMAYLTINSDTLIQQSQGFNALSVPGPGWVFIVQAGVMVCGMEETVGGAAFPRRISIARLSYAASSTIDVIALPLSVGGKQSLDPECYETPALNECAVCIACSRGSGMGCCVKPPTGPPPTRPDPCSF